VDAGRRVAYAPAFGLVCCGGFYTASQALYASESAEIRLGCQEPFSVRTVLGLSKTRRTLTGFWGWAGA
jgi:hypothetical protein